MMNYMIMQMVKTQDGLPKKSLKQFANNIRVPDLVKFSQCVEEHKYSDVVDENNNLARMIGLTATPSFITLQWHYTSSNSGSLSI